MDNNTNEKSKQYKCGQCSNTFTRECHGGRKPKFCSRYCGDKHKHNKYKKENSTKKRCKCCNVIFMSNITKQIFCSKNCSAKSDQNKLKEKTCNGCGKTFDGKRSQHFCSDDCKEEIRECLECHGDFTVYYYTPNKFCSKECSGKHHAIHECFCERCGKRFIGHKDRRNRYCSRECFYEQTGFKLKDYKYLTRLTDVSSRQRAIKYGVEYERIEPIKVFERDNWKCGICGEDVDERLPYPNTKSVSLDHVTPLSKDGTHTYDNVQCSHFGCNTKKNNRVPNEQLVSV